MLSLLSLIFFTLVCVCHTDHKYAWFGPQWDRDLKATGKKLVTIDDCKESK